MKKNVKSLAKDLISFLDKSPTAFQATSNIEKKLKAAGFKEAKEENAWKFKAGDRAFVKRNDSSLIAFIIGNEKPFKTGFKIVGAHTDSPLLKLKAESENKSGGSVRVATEVYGGPLITTWFDRDLGIAGRVMVKKGGKFQSKMVFIDKPVALIPSVAIHLNREANKGFEFNRQNHLQVILSSDSEAKDVLKTLIAGKIKEDPKNIHSMDVYVVDLQKGGFNGLDDELFSCGRLDNLQMCHAILESFLAVQKPNATTVAAFYDNEEIGSKTPMGADSNFMLSTLNRIVAVTSNGKDDYFRAISNSFLISADGAHAVHPNFADKHDPAYMPKLNKGPVIKMSASFRYATTSETSAEFERICEKAKVPFQKMANRSDVPSGSTIGPMSTAALGIKGIDIGNAMWAMHSVRETAGTLDHWYMCEALKYFYGE